MKKPAVLLSLITLIFATSGCGSDDPSPVTGGERPSPSSISSEEAPTETPSATAEATRSVTVWFVTDDGLQPSVHEIPDVEGIGAATLRSLLEGPTAAERGLDRATAIPEGTELLGLNISDGRATVDLSRSFDDGGGSASMLGRVAQIVMTLTEFPSVTQVTFQLDGRPVDALGGEGVDLSEPLRRSDVEEQLAPIVVEQPEIGSAHAGSLKVTGTANVFEATVSIRLVAAGGEVLVESFTTATCGTGCRGDYAETVPFEVAEETEATLEVFESSAEDGSPLHLVEIPVTLSPA